MNTEKDIHISIADDFSQFPGGRYPSDGEFNGTRFRTDFLIPALNRCGSGVVVVSLDGVAGLGSSFLEEAFGGLVREGYKKKDFLLRHLRIETAESDLQDFIVLANRYIQEA